MLGVPTSLAILIFDSNCKYVISVYERRRIATLIYIYVYIYIAIYVHMDTPFY